MSEACRGADAGGASFDYRDLRIFEPFAAEMPADLVGDGDRPTVRVAKLGQVVVGAYRLRPESALRFTLAALGVYAPYRGRGVGRWLLGHALGVAESKGGRSVVASGANPPDLLRFLAHAGFVAEGDAFVFHMTPE